MPGFYFSKGRFIMAEAVDILMRLAAAGFLGACIGFERRVHHKAIGIALASGFLRAATACWLKRAQCAKQTRLRASAALIA